MSNSLTPYNIDCFTDIIGLSENDCECLPENVNWDESYSGLMLDKAEGLDLRMIEATEDCTNENNLWLLMDQARSNAIRQFIADSNSKMLQLYELNRPAFRGNIGRQDYKLALTLSNTYACQRWATANVVGGYCKIKKITTIFSAVGTFDVTIYNNLNEVIETVTVDSIDGANENDVDILLPMWDNRITNLEYIFVYTYDATNKPKDSVVGCTSCGVNYIFDCRKPYYRSGSNKMAGWSKWLMAGSYNTNTLDFVDLPCCSGSQNNGLCMEVEFYCDLGKQFCFDEPDIYSPNFMTLAFAIWHQAAYKLIISILASPNVNRYTMLSGETLQALMKLHAEKYTECLNWLCENVDIRNTDCVKCREKIKIGVGVL